MITETLYHPIRPDIHVRFGKGFTRHKTTFVEIIFPLGSPHYCKLAGILETRYQFSFKRYYFFSNIQRNDLRMFITDFSYFNWDAELTDAPESKYVSCRVVPNAIKIGIALC